MDYCSLTVGENHINDELSLHECFGWIDAAYQSLPDQHSDELTWRIEQTVRTPTGGWQLRVAEHTLAASIWYAYAENAQAFVWWLQLFGWEYPAVKARAS